MDAKIDEPKYKSLKDYTDEELYWYLENNEKSHMSKLAGICSEILRRQLKPIILGEILHD